MFPIQIDPLLHLAEHNAPTTKMEDQNNIFDTKMLGNVVSYGLYIVLSDIYSYWRYYLNNNLYVRNDNILNRINNKNRIKFYVSIKYGFFSSLHKINMSFNVKKKIQPFSLLYLFNWSTINIINSSEPIGVDNSCRSYFHTQKSKIWSFGNKC